MGADLFGRQSARNKSNGDKPILTIIWVGQAASKHIDWAIGATFDDEFRLYCGKLHCRIIADMPTSDLPRVNLPVCARTEPMDGNRELSVLVWWW